MKTTLIILGILLIFGCKSLDLPSIDESEKKIKFCSSRIEDMDKSVNVWNEKELFDNDFMFKLMKDGINKIFQFLAGDRKPDINIYFLKKHPLIEEEKNIFGITYKNYLDIDTGYIDMFIKKMKCMEISKNKIKAQIELSGKGNIKISGRHTGIPASTNPDVELALNDDISFNIEHAAGDFFILTPEKKELKLQTKFFIKILKWQIPWSQEISIELTDVMKRFIIPMSIQTEVNFPVPSQKIDSQKNDFITYHLLLSNVKIIADKDMMDFRTDIDFIRK